MGERANADVSENEDADGNEENLVLLGWRHLMLIQA